MRIRRWFSTVRRLPAVGAGALVFGGALPACGQTGWEVWTATRDEVPLYREYRVAVSLKKGELIYGRRMALYGSWLRVRYHGGTYNARTWYLQRWDDLNARRHRDIAAAENRIARCDEAISTARAEATAYYRAAQSILYDSTIQYVRALSVDVAASASGSPLVRTVPGPGTSRARVIVAGPGRSPVSVVDRVDPGRARNLSRDWLDEVYGLDDRIASLQKQRRDAVEQKARLTALLDADAERFQRFRAGGDSLADWYVCLADRTPVYDGKRVGRELLRDTVVFAVPNRSYPEWLRVRIGKKWYDVRADRFSSKRAEIVDFARVAARTTRLVADWDERRTMLIERRNILRSLALGMKYRYNLRSEPAPAAVVLAREPERGSLYTVVSCPVGAEVTVNASRARRYIRRWEREIDALTGQIDDLRSKAEKKRLDLSRRRSRHERLMRLFAAAGTVPTTGR